MEAMMALVDANDQCSVETLRRIETHTTQILDILNHMPQQPLYGGTEIPSQKNDEHQEELTLEVRTQVNKEDKFGGEHLDDSNPNKKSIDATISTNIPIVTNEIAELAVESKENRRAASKRKQFLIVGTKNKAADSVAQAAIRARCHYVNKKWLGACYMGREWELSFRLALSLGNVKQSENLDQHDAQATEQGLIQHCEKHDVGNEIVENIAILVLQQQSTYCFRPMPPCCTEATMMLEQ
ncbi:hypothetical protein V6N11_064891 [Hibiscus sabdariffa]|uniref:BRCT domain-containing protein n=1 Tax=Hibiscus sabdariffa TaxID=183260 RepID=A0ABR2SI99_9ROSI